MKATPGIEKGNSPAQLGKSRLSFRPQSFADRVLTAVARLLLQRGQLWRANFSISGELAGEPLRVPFVFGAGWEHLVMREMWMLDVLRWILARRDGPVLDVGVNTGHTLIKVKVADRERAYVGFEPNPLCLPYTRRIIALNQFNRCTLVPVALSNQSGLADLFLGPDVDPSATIVEGFRDSGRYQQTMTVATAVGDEVVRALGISDVAVIKVDVEGGELEVLQGLRETIRRDAPYLFCEVLPVYDAASENGRFRLHRQSLLRDLVRGLGYAIFRVHGDASVEELEEFGTHGELSLSNYVFVPRRDADAFVERFAPALSRRSA